MNIIGSVSREIDRNFFPIDQKKVEVKEIKPETLELKLISSVIPQEFRMQSRLTGNDYDSNSMSGITLGQDKAEAEKKYEEMISQIKNGKYKVLLYLDGSHEIEFTP